MYCNNKFLKFDASEWIPMSKDDVEKMIDFLHKSFTTIINLPTCKYVQVSE